MFTRLYNEAFKAASNSSIMVFEPNLQMLNYQIFGVEIVDIVRAAGFSKPPGGEIGSAQHSFNAHTYCCQHVGCPTGEPGNDTADACDAFHRLRVGQRMDDAKRLGLPLFMSEFGACLDSEVCAREITQVADICEENLLGWSYWQYKTYKDLTTSAFDKSEGFYNRDGSLQTRKVMALSRPYV